MRHCLLALLVAMCSLSLAQSYKADTFLRSTPPQNISIEKQLAFGLRYGTSAFGFFDETDTATVVCLEQKKHRPWYTTGEFFAVELCNVACMVLGALSGAWDGQGNERWRGEVVYVASYTFLSPMIPHLIDEEFCETKGSLLGGAVGACVGSGVTAMLFEAAAWWIAPPPFFIISALLVTPAATVIGYHIKNGGEK